MPFSPSHKTRPLTKSTRRPCQQSCVVSDGNVNVLHGDGSTTYVLPQRESLLDGDFAGYSFDVDTAPELLRPGSRLAAKSAPILVYHIVGKDESWCFVYANFRRHLAHYAHLLLHNALRRETIRFQSFIFNDNQLAEEERFCRWTPATQKEQQFELMQSFFSDQLSWFDPAASDGGLSEHESHYVDHTSGFFGGTDCTLNILQALPNFWNETKILARLFKLEHRLSMVAKEGLNLVKRLAGVVALFQRDDPPNVNCTLAMALAQSAEGVQSLLENAHTIAMDMRVFVDADSSVVKRNVGKPNVYCDCCGVEGKLKRCQGCQLSFYCSVGCQKKSWPTHKQMCREVQEKKR